MQLDFAGRTILVTRPAPEASHTAQAIAAAGGRPLVVPALRILPPDDPAALTAAMGRLHQFCGVIITSANGARAFLQHWRPGIKSPPLYVVGNKSSRLLAETGLPIITPTDRFQGESLADAILEAAPWCGNFLFIRAEEGRDELMNRLERDGHHVELITAYRAEPITELPKAVLDELREQRVAAVTFFSGRSAAAFIAALPSAWEHWLGGSVIAALSEVTAATLREMGVRVDLVSPVATSEELLAALNRLWNGAA